MMNSFRLLGDMMHLMSILVLLLKIYTTRSCRGISLKTQELYLLVFICRYLDLLVYFVSLYNTFMKFVFLGSSGLIVYLMRFHKVIKSTYDKENDTFQYIFLIAPCAALAMFIHSKFTALELLWTFSIYLESVAILPQLWQLQRTSNIDNLTGNYVFLLGCYRALYILNWIYKYFTESKHSQWIVWLSGMLQTALYCDFFYYYLKSWKENKVLDGLQGISK
eukprot:TRINITY_DN19854_c0_g2_i2.p1 TRINITY_DN19854_c0_g2~~TRINITY_DN19854_c0_g2_i2.p1  ORF type:complete len:255 (-),score=-14.17 TRINITY_DN19854_c0_g2_i2:285-947(-)